MTEREAWTPFSDPEIYENRALQGKYGLQNVFGEILRPEYTIISYIAEDIYLLQCDTGAGFAILTDCIEEPFLFAEVPVPCKYDEVVYVNRNLILLRKKEEWIAFLLSSRYCTPTFERYRFWEDEFLQTFTKDDIMLYHLNQDALVFKNRHTEYEITRQGAGTCIVGRTDTGSWQRFYFEKNRLRQI